MTQQETNGSLIESLSVSKHEHVPGVSAEDSVQAQKQVAGEEKPIPASHEAHGSDDYSPTGPLSGPDGQAAVAVQENISAGGAALPASTNGESAFKEQALQSPGSELKDVSSQLMQSSGSEVKVVSSQYLESGGSGLKEAPPSQLHEGGGGSDLKEAPPLQPHEGGGGSGLTEAPPSQKLHSDGGSGLKEAPSSQKLHSDGGSGLKEAPPSQPLESDGDSGLKEALHLQPPEGTDNSGLKGLPSRQLQSSGSELEEVLTEPLPSGGSLVIVVAPQELQSNPSRRMEDDQSLPEHTSGTEPKAGGQQGSLAKTEEEKPSLAAADEPKAMDETQAQPASGAASARTSAASLNDTPFMATPGTVQALSRRLSSNSIASPPLKPTPSDKQLGSSGGSGVRTAKSPSTQKSGDATPPSTHDTKNTINVSQLLKKGAFKLQPLKDFQPYEELQRLRVEDGIDATRKEDYLNDADFEQVFGMDRDAFKKMPAWRQAQAKKKANLF